MTHSESRSREHERAHKSILKHTRLHYSAGLPANAVLIKISECLYSLKCFFRERSVVLLISIVVLVYPILSLGVHHVELVLTCLHFIRMFLNQFILGHLHLLGILTSSPNLGIPLCDHFIESSYLLLQSNTVCLLLIGKCLCRRMQSCNTFVTSSPLSFEAFREECRATISASCSWIFPASLSFSLWVEVLGPSSL
jgi:hypothetical protein